MTKDHKGAAATETVTTDESETEQPDVEQPECPAPDQTAVQPADGTTGDAVTAPAPEECTAPAPAPEEEGPKADVNLTGKGHAAEHNPNVNAEGQLQPGTAADKSDDAAPAPEDPAVTTDSASATADSGAAKVKAEHVAKVKAESEAKAKAERAKGEKGAYLVYVNGERLNLTPLEHNGRTMVPFRRLAEFLGATVTWEPASHSVTMVVGDKTVVIQIGSTTALVNGEPVEMPLAPELVESSTYVPLRFIAEAFGADVDFSEETGAITVITSPSAPADGTTPPADDTTTPPADDTTTPPADTTTPPADTTTPPADTTTQPADTTTQPADTTTQPSDTTTQPSDTTTQPSDTTTQPTNGTTQPAGN